MDEQEFLHKVSVHTTVNIELLKALYKHEEFMTFIKERRINEATLLIRSIQPKVGLREAKMVVEDFIAEKKE